MSQLLTGLLLFVGIHSLRLLAPAWREAQIARFGTLRWRGMHSVAALLGLVLIVRGYAEARSLPGLYWQLPFAARHGMLLGMLLAFILLTASQIPGTHIKQRIGHPMNLGLVLWSGLHLLFNARPAALLLFGTFFVWSLTLLLVSLKRDREAGVSYPPGQLSRDLLCAALALVAWLAFVLILHQRLIGVAVL
ncbi:MULTISPECIES: NnrU family protein [unclassified Paludibacterium]|uniref:NnrU family protein n=1 Tax=unclassified Paludibacterium TaxID=2618429 RepID=UPI001C04B3C6|nr:NnrU family protein [Paludibacterium sp. B53371]BEV71532.1 NnrU family protein [Paludibacterium sp. THUN1379]